MVQIPALSELPRPRIRPSSWSCLGEERHLASCLNRKLGSTFQVSIPVIRQAFIILAVIPIGDWGLGGQCRQLGDVWKCGGSFIGCHKIGGWTALNDAKCSPACGIILPPVPAALPLGGGVRVQLFLTPERVPAFPSRCHGNSPVWNAGLPVGRRAELRSEGPGLRQWSGAVGWRGGLGRRRGGSQHFCVWLGGGMRKFF